MRHSSGQKVEVGFCVYCGKKSPEFQLSREHVIARGLGALKSEKGHEQVVYASSCSSCANITNDLENRCMIGMFQPLLIQAASKRSKGSPLPNQLRLGVIHFKGKVTTMKVDSKVYPIKYSMPSFRSPAIPPGFPNLREPTEVSYLMNINLHDARRTTAGGIEISNPNPSYFMRMLAKIALSYCYLAFWGRKSFEPYLADLVRNPFDPELKSFAETYSLIGEAEKQIPDITNALHKVEHEIVKVEDRDLIYVRIRLFANAQKSITYEVIAGHLT